MEPSRHQSFLTQGNPWIGAWEWGSRIYEIFSLIFSLIFHPLSHLDQICDFNIKCCSLWHHCSLVQFLLEMAALFPTELLASLCGNLGFCLLFQPKGLKFILNNSMMDAILPFTAWGTVWQFAFKVTESI